MISGFWNTLKEKRPFTVLAPMADVTDVAFRRLIAGKGRPDVTWTEFVSADGLMSPGREHLLTDLSFSEGERPIVAQLFSSDPEKMEGAARLVATLGFDGIDINMGCPDRAVMRQGAGGALIRNPEKAVAVIEGAMRGAISGAKEGEEPIPVSVKTRVGYGKNELQTWLPKLLTTGIAAVTIHARTVKELSLVPARWEHVAEAVAIRDRLGSDALVIGNGDAKDVSDGIRRAREAGADGAMLGRAIFGNPWLFDQSRTSPPSIDEKLSTLAEHAALFEKLLSGRKSFSVMKKHFKAYVSDFDGAKELRIKLMEEGNDAAAVRRIIDDHLSSLH